MGQLSRLARIMKMKRFVVKIAPSVTTPERITLSSPLQNSAISSLEPAKRCSLSLPRLGNVDPVPPVPLWVSDPKTWTSKKFSMAQLMIIGPDFLGGDDHKLVEVAVRRD